VSQLGGKAARQPLHRSLRRAVNRHPGEGSAGAHGRDIDDARRSRKVRHHGLGHKERSSDIHIVDASEILGGDLAERSDELDTGVVNQDVDLVLLALALQPFSGGGDDGGWRGSGL